MALQLQHTVHTLKFTFKAGTSRGIMTENPNYIIKLFEPGHPEIYGLGECGPLPGLSVDDQVAYDEELPKLAQVLKHTKLPEKEAEVYSWVQQYIDASMPALRFAMETAMIDLLHGGQFILFKNRLIASGDGIPINGLIWMGDSEWMLGQIEEKLAAGFTCLKMKIGAIDFEEECRILESIRKRFSSDQITLRVDANGAFPTNEALMKLKILSQFDLHSIEQPIMPRQPEAMHLLASKSKVPVALDEELIGVDDEADRLELLDFIKPAYLVLKPTLLGGIASTKRWIALAEARKINWWITSALESNIGLNAIAQLTAEYPVTLPQGLGTGQLYHNNISSPLEIKQGNLYFNPALPWDDALLQFKNSI